MSVDFVYWWVGVLACPETLHDVFLGRILLKSNIHKLINANANLFKPLVPY